VVATGDCSDDHFGQGEDGLCDKRPHVKRPLRHKASRHKAARQKAATGATKSPRLISCDIRPPRQKAAEKYEKR